VCTSTRKRIALRGLEGVDCAPVCGRVWRCFCLTWGFTKLWAFVHDYIIQKLLERLTVTLKDSDSTQRV
jgi:hypothetical protein